MPDNQENPMSKNQETSNNLEAPPEWFDETYSDPQNSGEADGAVQQQLFESIPDDPEQRVATYVGSLMERGVLQSDSEERGQDQPGGQEYDQAAEDMNRIADIEHRVQEGQELTTRDIYFLRKYDSEIQKFGYDDDPRIDELLQDRDASADLDMMLEEFDQAQLFRDMMDSGVYGMEILTYNLDKFPDGAVDHAELARNLMNNGGGIFLTEHLEKFPSEAVDQTQLARDLMDRGWVGMSALAENLDKFPDGAVDHAELARHLMRHGGEHIIVANLDKFPPEAVDHDRLAHDMMNKGRAGEADPAKILDKFQGKEDALAENLEMFIQSKTADKVQLVRALLDSGLTGRITLAANLDKFLQSEAIDQTELVREMMDSRHLVGMQILAQNLDKFLQSEAVDQTQLARDLLDNGGEVIVADNLDKFPDGAVDEAELARYLMNENKGSFLAENLDKFPDDAVDHQELARNLMHNDQKVPLAKNLEKFQPGAADYEELARDLMHSGWKVVLVQNLDKFPPEAVDQAELARRMMNNNLKSILARNLHKFREVPDDVRDILS
jgi:thiazole synthase ThiGH ThiG subunit